MEKEDTIRTGVLTHEDKESLLSLLCEYEEKLMILCQKISDTGNNITTYKYIVLLLLFLLQSFVLIVFALPRYFSFIFTLFSNFTFAMTFYIIMLCISYILMFYIRGATQQKHKKFRLVRNEARRIATRLEKVVRLGYQIQENMNCNVVTKVELDLRLADAESALEYYYELIKKEKELTDFHPFKAEVKNTP